MNSLWKLLAGGINLPFCFIEGDAAGGGGVAAGGGAGAGGDTGAGAGASTGADTGAGTGGEGAGTGTAAAAPEVKPGDNPREFLRDAVSKVKIDSETGQRVEEKTQTPEEKAAADLAAKAEAEKAAAAKAGEGQPQPKTEEELEAEKQKAEAEKAEKDKQQTEANPLDKGGPVPAEKLAEALKTTPELAAALEKAGIDKEQLFETSRRAALSEQFLEHFPTPEAAKFGRESAEHFYDIEESFPKIQSTQDLDKFITGTMLPLSIQYGPDGKPVMNEDGKTFKTDGSVSRFINLIGDFDQGVSKGLAASIIEQGVRAGGDQGEQIKEYGERLKAALDVVQEFRAAGYKMPTPKGQTAELSPEQKAENERLRKENAEFHAKTTEEQEKQTTAYEESLFKDATEDTEKFLRETVHASSLTDFEKESIIAKVYETVGAKMEADRTFKQLKAQLWNQGQNDQTRQQIRALNKRTFQVYATRAVNELMEKVGGKRIQQNADRLKKIDAQIDKDKMHQTTGTSTGTAAARVPTGDDLYNQAITELTKELGRSPREAEIFTRTLVLKGLRQKTA